MNITKKVLISTGICLFLGACGQSSENLSGGSNSLKNSSTAATSSTPATSGNGLITLRCEKRGNRSKISVDANNVTPGTYSASVSSGGVDVFAPKASSIGDEVEFDFDSDGGDIAAGAVAISPSFIQGKVSGTLYDVNGASMGTATIDACSVVK